MGSSDQNIGVVISAQDLTADAIASAKNNVSGLASAATDMGEKGSTAFKGMGFAAKDMFHELGVGGPVARYLGHEVMDLASTLGNVGTAFGGAAIAGMVAYKVYDHFTGETAALRDEQIKLGESMANQALGMEKNRDETDQLKTARYNLYVMTEALAKKNNELAISAMTQKIIDQVEVINKGGTSWDRFSRQLELGAKNAWQFFSTGTVSERWSDQTAKDLAKPRSELEKMALTMQDLRIQQIGLAGGPQSKSQFEGLNNDSELKAQEKRVADYYAMITAMRNKSAYAEEEKAGDVDAYNVSLWNAGMDRLQKMTAAEEQANAERLKSAQHLAKEKERIDKTIYDMEANLAGDMLLLALQSGKDGAEAQKRDAEYAIIVNTAVGVAKALATYTYPQSLYIGALVAAAGAVQYAKASSANYGGSSSIDASSSGSSSSSSSGSGYKYFDYEQSTYGTGWRPGSNTSGVTLVVQGDVIASDANSVQKWVSKVVVSSIQNNEYGVNKAIKKYV